jgi:hypothetical protein
MPIVFTASLKRPGKCLKIDAERECEVSFSVPASEIAEVIKLIGLSDKGLIISVDSEVEA